MTIAILLFSILSILAIASAIITVASKHPIRSAMALVAHFFSLSGIYLTLNAQFLAVLQVLVYAGAIMVLVIFVIMLLNIGSEEKMVRKFQSVQYLAIGVAIAFALMLTTILIINFNTQQFNPNLEANIGSVESLGKLLYSNYLFPIQAVAILLTTAIFGAIILAKRKLD